MVGGGGRKGGGRDGTGRSGMEWRLVYFCCVRVGVLAWGGEGGGAGWWFVMEGVTIGGGVRWFDVGGS